MDLINLFLAFFRIGLFAIGGAYSFLPLLEKEIVQRYNWLTKDEFLDVLGVVKVLPGAISIKYATYIGYRMAGIMGVIVANLGNILAPALLILLAGEVCLKYKDLARVKHAFAYVQLAVFAMLIAVAFQLVNLNQLWNLKSIFIVGVTFILFLYSNIHPALIILGAAIVGILFKGG